MFLMVFERNRTKVSIIIKDHKFTHCIARNCAMGYTLINFQDAHFELPAIEEVNALAERSSAIYIPE